MIRTLSRLLLGGVLAAGCQGAGVAPPVTGLAGTVRFAGPRTAQASLAEVASAATVSLIDAVGNRTEATALTDDQGRFRFSFAASYTPTRGRYYYLEAIKGLAGNLPGHAAARVRTLAYYDGAWLTLTNGSVGGTVVLDVTTTAVAIAAALLQLSGQDLELGALIGAVSPADDAFTEVPGLSSSDVGAVSFLVTSALQAGRDPVGDVTLVASRSWQPVSSALALRQALPASARVGEQVCLQGCGFDPDRTGDRVWLGEVELPVLNAQADALTVLIPPGAVTATLSVEVGPLICRGPTFTVTGALPGTVDPSAPRIVSGAIPDAP